MAFNLLFFFYLSKKYLTVVLLKHVEDVIIIPNKHRLALKSLEILGIHA